MSLFSSLLSSRSTLQTFQKGLSVAQNNVANVNTPGYVKQRLPLQAAQFDPERGIAGGVNSGPVESGRNDFLDRSIRGHQQNTGYYEQKSSLLTAIENQFDVTGQGGLNTTLNQFFQAFSSLSVSPNDPVQRNKVISSAQDLVAGFRSLTGRLDEIAGNVDQQLDQNVKQINELAGQLAKMNAAVVAGGSNDPALDASINATLEQLSNLAPVNVLQQQDGSYTVLLAGRVPLVTGAHTQSIQVESNVAGSAPGNTGAPSSVRVHSQEGVDVTQALTGGQLGALVEVRNTTLAGLRGDGNQQGSINQLAESIARRVNTLLSAGQTTDTPPQAGVPLFTYDPSQPAAIVRTLAVNPALTPDRIATANPGPPAVSNGIALQLAGLAQSTDPADQINGATYQNFFGNVIAGVGRESAAASSNQNLEKSMLSQAETLRQDTSGVNLDEEALYMLQFQRAYQATSQFIRALDDVTQQTLAIIR
ncbi:MAG: flagellar hook-associated protein FlgK [Anaerolineaceae bacterium]